jgi:FMN-dependent NADH-azoreductase
MTNPATLLHIQASPRKERSHSFAVAQAFLDHYRALHGADSVATLDLWSTSLPPVDAATIDAKFAVMSGTAFTPEQRQAWNNVIAHADHFKSATGLLFTVPMWNRSIPYVLKHYIDLITQPGVLFQRTSAGYRPLGPDRPALVVYASGSDFSSTAPLHPFDFQKPYFSDWLRFVGITQIEEIVVAPTVGDPQALATAKAAAIQRVTELAQSFRAAA